MDASEADPFGLFIPAEAIDKERQQLHADMDALTASVLRLDVSDAEKRIASAATIARLTLQLEAAKGNCEYAEKREFQKTEDVAHLQSLLDSSIAENTILHDRVRSHPHAALIEENNSLKSKATIFARRYKEDQITLEGFQNTKIENHRLSKEAVRLTMELNLANDTLSRLFSFLPTLTLDQAKFVFPHLSDENLAPFMPANASNSALNLDSQPTDLIENNSPNTAANILLQMSSSYKLLSIMNENDKSKCLTLVHDNKYVVVPLDVHTTLMENKRLPPSVKLQLRLVYLSTSAKLIYKNSKSGYLITKIFVESVSNIPGYEPYVNELQTLTNQEDNQECSSDEESEVNPGVCEGDKGAQDVIDGEEEQNEEIGNKQQIQHDKIKAEDIKLHTEDEEGA
ncbi:hypothetical protein HDU99_000193, partial [Rhizoclosmatium hyalinum]